MRYGCALLLAAWALTGCGSGEAPESAQQAPPPDVDVRFTDATASAGIDFVHHNGRSGQKYLPETMGSGLAFFDYNDDDWPDLFLVNGQPWNPEAGSKSTSKLYRNNRDGTFSDVTTEAGLAVEMFGMGVAAADYDNDGNQDLYVSAYGEDRLFRNNGNGTFADVSSEIGIRNSDFGTSVAWFDYDRDGFLDLFVANYVEWSPAQDIWCSLDGDSKSYCTPESYNGATSRLFRNQEGKRFREVTEEAGLLDESNKALGVALLDFDTDGWLDLFLANDTQPNKLYRNSGDSTFSEEGMMAGIAFGEDGQARGAMGVDAADYDNSGRPHLLIGNFSNQMITLYHNEGNGLFVDEAPVSAIGPTSLLSLTFGTFFFDYDLDGRLDIFAANGHLDEEIENVQPKVGFRQSPLLYRNVGEGGFHFANGDVGEQLSRPLVGRGAAYADYDRDGDLDLAITSNNGPAFLYRNDGGNTNNFLSVKLEGSASNRNAVGAVVRVHSASGDQWNMVRSGSSYCSQSSFVLTFGLGGNEMADTVVVEWPNGGKTTLTDVPANQFLTVAESE